MARVHNEDEDGEWLLQVVHDEGDKVARVHNGLQGDTLHHALVGEGADVLSLKKINQSRRPIRNKHTKNCSNEQQKSFIEICTGK